MITEAKASRAPSEAGDNVKDSVNKRKNREEKVSEVGENVVAAAEAASEKKKKLDIEAAYERVVYLEAKVDTAIEDAQNHYKNAQMLQQSNNDLLAALKIFGTRNTKLKKAIRHFATMKGCIEEINAIIGDNEKEGALGAYSLTDAVARQ